MKVIDQYHEILHITPNVMKLVEACGRICYKSEDKITDTSAKKFVEKLNRLGHGSVLEHSQITVRFVTDRGISHELVRARLASYSQESTRYCRYDGDMVFIRPVWCSDDVLGEWSSDKSWGQNLKPDELVWLSACEQSTEHYTSLLDQGWSPQKARTALNHSLKTEIAMTANIREWQHTLKLRIQKAAHPQIRALMFNLMKDLQQQIPIVFDDIILKTGMEEINNG
jgi:thymidylate synthase (FAD)